jgi:DNA-binding NtrC family response regulator
MMASGRSKAGDTTAPASSLAAEITARVQQLYLVHAPETAHDAKRERLVRVTVDAPELVLGREPEGAKALAIADLRVSRNHAVLARDATTGDVSIIDRSSRHGTIVDGRRVERAPLVHGTVIRLGESIFVFVDRRLTVEEAKTLAPETAALRGASLAMQLVRGEISLVARRPLPVLILGETGVGKERVAQEIHRQSGRHGPLVALNCAAIAPTLAETELFGYAAGAFTGATHKSEGLFVAAHGGTLFLDEIAELPSALQPKLLRAIATGEVRAVGRAETRQVDVRLVAATHGNLEGAVHDGGFRGDLLARLSGWTLRVPPLRERREDVLSLARWVLERDTGGLRISTNCAEALVLHGWPFNVRELEQVLAAAAIRAKDGVIRPEHLPHALARPISSRVGTSPSDPPATPLAALVSPDEIPDAEGLGRVVQWFDGNVARVAAYFGKDRKQIYRWAEKLSVDLDSARASGGSEGKED